MAKKDIDVVEIIIDSFKFLFDNPGIIVYYLLPILTLILATLMFGFSFFFGAGLNIKFTVALIGQILTIGIIAFLLNALATASAIIKTNQPKKSYTYCLRKGLNKTPKLFVATILSGLAVFAGMVAFIIPGIYIMVRLAVVAPACVLEKELGLKKSWNYTQKKVWDVFALILLLFIVNIVAAMIPLIGMFLSILIIGPVTVIAYTKLYKEIK